MSDVCSKLHGQLEVHGHPEGRWQPAHRLVRSAHSHEHHRGLLRSRLPERPERDVCRKVGGVVPPLPLTQPETLSQSELTTYHASHWLGLQLLTDKKKKSLCPHWPNVALMQRAWLPANSLSASSLWSWMCCGGNVFFLQVLTSWFVLMNVVRVVSTLHCRCLG